MTSKHLALALFVSLGANLFLGGLLVGSMGDHDEHHHAPLHPPKAAHHDAKPGPGQAKQRPLPPPGDRDDRRSRDQRGRRDGGPDDLMLLRTMVRVMGGPSDPRVQKLRENSREDIRQMRQDLRVARDKVEAAFEKEPFDDAALAAAMEEVRQRGNAAQKRAQDGVLKLAALMTDEERKQLRKVARDDRMKRPDRMGDRKGWKGQKPEDRPRAQPDPKSEIE